MLGGIGLNKGALNASGDVPPAPIIADGNLIAIEQTVLGPPLNRGGFSLNARRLNLDAINAFSALQPAGGTLIAIEQEVVEPNEGTLIAIEQKVGHSASGTLIAIEQTVIFIAVADGNLILIEQEVVTTQAGTLIRIEQRVKNSAETIPSHLERTGWDIIFYVGGNSVTCPSGEVSIQRNEGGASLMDITFSPGVGSGIQNVEGYAGEPVTLDIETKDGVFRAFTGIVDIGEVDLIKKTITLHCTDRRSELINAQLGTIVNSIGYSSPIIFPTPKDTFANLNNRLTTIPFTVDFDPYGNFHIANINPKAIPDFTITGVPPDGVFYKDPKVEYTSRGRLTNKITVAFQYRFPRLWQMERLFSWHTSASICDVLLRGYTMAQRAMIQASVEGTGWPLHGDVSYIPITPSGFYCGSIWSTVHLTGETTNVLDEDGNQIMDTVWVEDPDTHFNVQKEVPRTEGRITGGTDIGILLADGASWRAAKRWVQTVTENYTMVVQAPQSIAQFGIIDAFAQYSGEDPSQTDGWENFQVWDNPYNKGISVEDQNYFVDTATNRGAINGGIVTALAIAQTTIAKSHRDTRVTVQRALWPQIDLKHTVLVDADITNGGGITAKGKVYTIEHRLDIGTGESVTQIVLALSRSEGSGSNSGLSVPFIPPDTTKPDFSPIILGNHFGIDPSTEAAKTWTGFVGNKFAPFFRSTYPAQFIVDAPRIDDAFRIERNTYGSGTYNVAIPNDVLVVEF